MPVTDWVPETPPNFTAGGALQNNTLFPTWFNSATSMTKSTGADLIAFMLAQTSQITPSGGDDTAILNALTGPVTLSGGQFQVTSGNVTFPYPVAVAAGSSINVGTGKTVAFNGGFFYPYKQQVFYNATASLGTVTFAPAFTTEGYPEWWGAIPNNAGVTTLDCAPGINAAIVALPITRLQAATYYVQGQIKLSVENHSLVGARGWRWQSDTYPWSKIELISDGNTDMVLLGLASNPGSTSGYLNGIYLENIQLTRQSAPNAPASGYNGPACLRVQYALLCYVNNCFFDGSNNGAYITAAISCHFTYNVARCLQASPVNTSNDYFMAFNIDQSPNIGAASGTASLYFSNNFAINGPSRGSTVDPYNMFFTQNGFTDLYIRENESAGCNGVWANASTTNATSAQDLHITGNVFDSCPNWGIKIASSAAAAYLQNMTISDNYCTSSGGALLQVSNFTGTASITDNQLLGSTVGAMLFTTCNGIIATGNQASATTYMETWNNCFNFKSSNVHNHSVGTSDVSVVITNTCGVAIVEPIIRGTASVLAYGVSVDSGTTKIEVRCSGIDSSAISGGHANKIEYNGSPWGGSGTFGTNNLATGLLAA